MQERMKIEDEGNSRYGRATRLDYSKTEGQKEKTKKNEAYDGEIKNLRKIMSWEVQCSCSTKSQKQTPHPHKPKSSVRP